MPPTLQPRVPLAVLLWLAFSLPAAAQTERPASALASEVPAIAAVVSNATSVVQLHVRWLTVASASGAPVRAADAVPINQFAVTARSLVPGPLGRERDPQWSEHDLIVVSVDAAGRETSWQKVRDPRVLRAEFPGPTGELVGEVLYKPEVELVAALPDEATARLVVYEARWTGDQVVLRALGQIDVTRP